LLLLYNPLRTPHPLGDDFGPDLPLLFKLHEIWLVDFLENRQNRCHHMSDFMAKMHQILLRLGLRPRPRWPLGELTALPQTPKLDIMGPTSLPTCLLLTHVALCQRVSGVIARTRHIHLLTYISSTIGCANFGPDWPLLFKVHEI